MNVNTNFDKKKKKEKFTINTISFLRKSTNG